MSGDEIESLSQIRERGLRSDPRNNAANAQKLCRAAPKCVFAGVDSESFVAKKAAEVEKITGATHQIENLKRRRAIKPEVLKMLNVDADPVRCVFVGVDFSRVGSVEERVCAVFLIHPDRSWRGLSAARSQDESNDRCAPRGSAQHRAKIVFRVYAKVALGNDATKLRFAQGTTGRGGLGFQPIEPIGRDADATTVWKPSLFDLYPDQTSGAFVDAESASPAVTRNELLPVEGLLVTPKHIECRAGRFFPAKLVIHMPFP